MNAGEQVPLRVSRKEEWFFLVFGDGQSALAAGPVDPVIPAGFFPVGVILAIVGLPLLGGLLALRLEHALRKVERASDALAGGDLGARVENPEGASAELAARFNAMADKVERLVRSRDELVQAVSHELGAPLSRLRFHLELLESGSPAQWEERTLAMGRELDALDALVAELLEFIQSDELTLDLRSFAPGRGVRDLAELARLEALDGSAIEIDLDVQDGAEVVADPRYFQRAVENVLRNAMQHARDKVLLELAEEGGTLRVTVHDDGPGIPEGQREKVVQPFVRLEADRGRDTGGTGLGLAIASRIVRRHGGRLRIGTSALGGAAVETSWPVGGG